MIKIVIALLFAVFTAPLLLGLQHFGLFRPRLWQVLLVGLGVGGVLQLLFGSEASFIVGYFGLPLFVFGIVILIASFFYRKRKPESARGETKKE